MCFLDFSLLVNIEASLLIFHIPALNPRIHPSSLPPAINNGVESGIKCWLFYVPFAPLWAQRVCGRVTTWEIMVELKADGVWCCWPRTYSPEKLFLSLIFHWQVAGVSVTQTKEASTLRFLSSIRITHYKWYIIIDLCYHLQWSCLKREKEQTDHCTLWLVRCSVTNHCLCSAPNLCS